MINIIMRCISSLIFGKKKSKSLSNAALRGKITENSDSEMMEATKAEGQSIENLDRVVSAPSRPVEQKKSECVQDERVSVDRHPATDCEIRENREEGNKELKLPKELQERLRCCFTLMRYQKHYTDIREYNSDNVWSLNASGDEWSGYHDEENTYFLHISVSDHEFVMDQEYTDGTMTHHAEMTLRSLQDLGYDIIDRKDMKLVYDWPSYGDVTIAKFCHPDSASAPLWIEFREGMLR